jgi:hypothetical protein
MSTAFAATLLSSHNIGPNMKVAKYSLQLPSSWTAAGVAWDLSGNFDYVFGAVFGVSGAVGDTGTKLSLFGTVSTSADKSKGGIAAASVSIGSHNSAGSAAVFAATADAVDLSAVNDLTVIVFGC